MSGEIERNLVHRLNLYGWIILLAMSGASAAVLPPRVATGVFVGALIVAVNLLLLRRVVRKALAPGSKVTPKSVLPKYYLTFALTALVIFILISQRVVNELGLLLGLAGFAINVFIVVFQEMGKIILKQLSKEAV